MGLNDRPHAVSLTSLLCGGLLACCTAGAPPAEAEDGTASPEQRQLRPPPEDFELVGDEKNGKAVYKVYCKKCHGKRGDGTGIMAVDLKVKPRDFTDGEYMLEQSDWALYLGIKEGGKAVGLSDQMTAWEDTLTEEEMLDVAVYIRTFAIPEQ
jgi:mono/diheme cytochrome c family protein